MGTKLLSWLYGGMDGMLSISIFQHIIRMNIIDNNSKSLYTGKVCLYGVLRDKKIR